MISAQPLSLEILWLDQYDAPGRRVAMARLARDCCWNESPAGSVAPKHQGRHWRPCIWNVKT
jgi:hypothetical protein